ncbi:hypothetical protein ACI3ER_11765 [Bacillus sp. Wb]
MDIKQMMKIDELVSEKVLECKVEYVGKDGVYVVGEEKTGVFSPSRNIQDAWLLVDKLLISIFPQAGDPPKEYKYFVECDPKIYDVDSSICEAFGETASLAICKVALKAVGIEIDDLK